MFDIERVGEEHRKLSYNDVTCVGCGICVDTCPTSSLRLGPLVPIARGLIGMDLISVSDSCVFCGLCSVACPFDALSLTIDGNNIKNDDSYPLWEVQSTIDEGIESVFQGFEMRKETQVLAQHKVSCLNKHLLKLIRHGRTIPKLVEFYHERFGLLLAFFGCGSGKGTHLLLGERGIVGKGFEPLRRKRENGQQNNKEQQYSFTIHQVIVLFINDLCQI